VGQKVNPVGFRLGVYRDWLSKWFARDSYGDQVLEDVKIRRFLNNTLVNAELSSIEIEKAGDALKVILHSGRPGVVIGKKGEEIQKLREKLIKLTGKPSVEVTVQEVKNPELDAQLVAKNIALQIERRGNYKQVMKRASASTMKSGALGINIRCAGRLAGAEIARDEWIRIGRIPRHTLRSDLDHALAEANTKYGIIGVQVWICRGEFRNERQG
jgi:small subunit ribosomal protein S3